MKSVVCVVKFVIKEIVFKICGKKNLSKRLIKMFIQRYEYLNRLGFAVIVSSFDISQLTCFKGIKEVVML